MKTVYGIKVRDIMMARQLSLMDDTYMSVNRLATRLEKIGVQVYYNARTMEPVITTKELLGVPAKIQAYAEGLKDETRKRGRYAALVACWWKIIIPATIKNYDEYRIRAEEKVAA